MKTTMKKSAEKSTKIIHLWVQDPFGNKKTLVCLLKDESIRYVFYGGIADGGTPYSLSNLQCTLPIEPNEGESMKVTFAFPQGGGNLEKYKTALRSLVANKIEHIDY
jgi:hypothetical protein